METGDGIAPHADIVDLGVGDVVCGVGADDGAKESPRAEGARREPGHVLWALLVHALRQLERDEVLHRVEDCDGGDLEGRDVCQYSTLLWPAWMRPGGTAGCGRTRTKRSHFDR